MSFNNLYRRPDNLLHGTTTIGLVCKDGVVLAADTRATSGFFVAHKNTRKIYEIDRHLGITITGTVADCQKIADYLKFYANLYKVEEVRPMPIQSAARLAANILYSTRMYPMIADVLVAGLDSMGPSIFNVDPLGSLTQEKYVSTGSGSPVAYGLLETDYKESISVEEAVNLAVRAVVAAIRRNIGTGDGFNVVAISNRGFQEYSLQDKQRILTSLNLTLT